MKSKKTFTWRQVGKIFFWWFVIVVVIALLSEFLLLPWSTVLMASSRPGALLLALLFKAIHFLTVGLPFDTIAPAIGYIFTGEFYAPLIVKIVLYPLVCVVMTVISIILAIIAITPEPKDPV